MAHHDWKNSHPLDLTDEGLMADLEKRGGKVMVPYLVDPNTKALPRNGRRHPFQKP